MDRNSPALLFSTEQTREALASRGIESGFMLGDWEFARNDLSLGVGRLSLTSNESYYMIWQEDRLWESNGRPHSHSRTVIRNVSYGGRSR